MGSSITCTSCWLMIIIFMFSSSLVVLSNDDELIQQTCKNTKYYDLCVSSLKSGSLKAADTKKGLALIMIKVGINNATATNSYLSLLSQILTNDTLMKRVMRECADKYASANQALENSVQHLTADMYDYAYMDVMAASDYPNACHNAFIKAYPAGLVVYPQELAKREEALKRICDVALGIINALIEIF